MKTWVTSDLHFGHANILKFNPDTRRYANVEDMNIALIGEWNYNVQTEDLVYILGDFAFLNAVEATKIAKRLNGTKILITGNHDKKLLKSDEFRFQFHSIHSYLDIDYNKEKICMFHFPILEWDRCHRGSYHLFGHLHGAPTPELDKFRAMDVGIDATGNVVTAMDDVISKLQNRPFKTHGTI